MAETRNDRVGLVLGSISHAQGFGRTFGRRIACTWRGAVHIATVVLREVSRSLAINLARRHVEKALHAVMQPIVQEVSHTFEVRKHHLHGLCGKTFWIGTAGRINDVIKRLHTLNGSTHIHLHEMEPWVVGISLKPCRSPLGIPPRCIHLNGHGQGQ